MSELNLSQDFLAKQTASGSQLSNNIQGKDTISSAVSTILELKPGDVFRGEIIAVGGEEVTLKLANEQLLAARMEGQIQLAIGQVLGFQVQTNDNNRIVLKPVFANQIQMQVGEAALKTAGIVANEKNMQLIAELIENGLPIDKKSLSQIYRQVLQNPNADIQTVVQLNKLHLPVNDNNVMFYQNNKELNARIVDSVRDIAQDIWKIADSLKNEQKMDDVESRTELSVNKDFHDTNVVGKDTGIIFSKDSSILDSNITSDKNVTEDNQILPKNLSMTDTMQQENVIQSEVSFTNRLLQVLFQEKTEGMQNTFSVIPDQTLDANKMIDLLKNDDLSLKQFMDILNQKTGQILTDDEKNILFHSKIFRNKVEEWMREEFSISPEKIAEEGEVEKFYKKLYSQITKLENLIEENTLQSETVQTKSLQNMKQSLEFINDVNQLFGYVQLPVKFSDHSTAHGELYVYTNKKRMSQNEGIFTAYLHLDMDHLGPVNVNISLDCNQNKVTTLFEVTKEVVSFMASYMKELNDKLEKLGYQVKSKVAEISMDKTLKQQLIEQSGTSNVMLSYQTFDMRA